MKKLTTHKATIALLIMLMAVGLLASCAQANSQGSNSSTPRTTQSPAETTEAPTTTATNPTEESIAEPTIEATENTKPPQSQEPTSTNKQNSSTEKPTSSNGSTGNTSSKPESNKPSDTPSSTGVANTKTGISWDGVSPIIYTYADGTTGTKPVEGATYESKPGVTTTYKTYESTLDDYYKNGVHYCCDCGREEGDGTKGTCIQWLAGSEHTCPNCGDIVPKGVCHTCGDD